MLAYLLEILDFELWILAVADSRTIDLNQTAKARIKSTIIVHPQ